MGKCAHPPSDGSEKKERIPWSVEVGVWPGFKDNSGNCVLGTSASLLFVYYSVAKARAGSACWLSRMGSVVQGLS